MKVWIKNKWLNPPQPWEFRSKPAWQRLIIMLGGVFVNMVLAMFIYAMLLYKHGETYLPMENATYGIAVQDSLGYELGLADGDKIVSINGKKVESFNDFLPNLLLDKAKTVEVNRNGEAVILEVPEGLLNKLLKVKNGLVSVRLPVEVLEPAAGSAAEKLGLQKGDRLIAINGEEARFLDQFTPALKEQAGKNAEISFQREGQVITDSAQISDEGRLGFNLNVDYGSFFNVKTKKYGFLASFPAGIDKGVKMLVNYVKQIGLLFSGEVKAKDSVGGFISIGKIFPDKWDWFSVLEFDRIFINYVGIC